ncbi:MAG: hypothetical protein AAF514_18085 [Verrucomicrobiota bacterium]
MISRLMQLANPGTRFNRPFFDAIDRLSLASIREITAHLDNHPGQNHIRFDKTIEAVFTRWATLDPTGAWETTLRLKNRTDDTIRSVLQEIAATNPEMAKDFFGKISDPRIKRAARTALCYGAPELAFQLAQEESSGESDPWHYGVMFTLWALEDPESAISNFEKVHGQRRREAALDSISRTLAGNPDRALRFAASLTRAKEQDFVLQMLTETLSKTDPQKALTLLAKTALGPSRTQTLENMASNWADVDPHGAETWIRSLPPADQAVALHKSLWSIGRHSLERAANLLASAPSSFRALKSYDSLARQWTGQDPDGARSWIDDLEPGPARDQAVSGMFDTLLVQDHVRAAELIAETGAYSDKKMFLGSLLSNWAKEDKDAAILWLDRWETDEHARDEVVLNMVRQWATHNVIEAAEYAIGLEDDQRRDQAIEALVGGWADEDPEGAKDWALSELEGSVKHRSINSVINILAKENIVSALDTYEKATSGMSPEETVQAYGDAVTRIASSWAEYDPLRASEWTLQQPESSQRDQAIGTVVDHWAGYDPANASEFVNSLPEGSGRDIALDHLSGTLAWTDPEAAFQWATGIMDDNLRTRALRHAASRWMPWDAEAAAEALKKAGIPEEPENQENQTNFDPFGSSS